MSPSLRAPRCGPVFTRWASLLLVLCAAAASVFAEDPIPEAPQEAPQEEPRAAPLSSRVRIDLLGEVTRLARQADLALAGDDLLGALDQIMDLAERYPDAVQPVTTWGVEPQLHATLQRPLVELAGVALARLVALEPGLRARLEARWGSRAAIEETAARRGNRAALERLARDYAPLPAGARALLLLADLQEEEADRLGSARSLECWLGVMPQATPAARAAIVVRLAGLLAQSRDSGALTALSADHASLLQVPVPHGSSTRTLAGVVAEVRAAESGRPAPQGTPAPFEDGEDLVGLWSLDLADPQSVPADGLLQPWNSLVTGTVARQGEDVFVHAGRRVRCVDRWTGLSRWVFPSSAPPALHAANERYQEPDLPYRVVVPAGAVLLTVLGDPVASGDYQFRAAQVDAHVLGQECRTRLVALDARTGELRWCTGTAEERHPVLGDPTCGCISPPLVDGDRVYALFGRLSGGAEVYLACLDLATGAVRYVSWIGAGVGGRTEDRSEASRRAGNPYVIALPWAAAPSLAGDELCVQPHAGFAAGVDVSDGRVRWVQVLRRYPHDELPPVDGGQRVSNAPLAWGDAWILAPMDSPDITCVARGSGALRWRTQLDALDGVPVQILGVVDGADGAPVLQLGGARVFNLDPATGLALPAPAEIWGEDQSVFGRVTRHGSWWVGSDGWRLLAVDRSTTQDRATPVHYAGEMGLSTGLMRLDLADVTWCDPLWLVLDENRLVCVTTLAGVQALSAQRLRGTPERRLLVRGLLASAAVDAGALLDEVCDAANLPDTPQATEVRERLARELARQVHTELAPTLLVDRPLFTRLLQALPCLAPEGRVALRHRLLRRALDEGLEEAAAALLSQWLRDADRAWVELGGRWRESAELSSSGSGERLRSDLLAGRWLSEYCEGPARRDLLADWEAECRVSMDRALEQGETALRACIANCVGTRAAARGREALIQRLAESGRYSEAADLAADRRLDPPIEENRDPRTERLRRAAGWALQEASWRMRAEDGTRARTLLADMLRWAPSGITDDQGATRDVLEEACALRFGWHPERRLDPPEARLVASDGEASSAEEIRAVELLGLEGPGADRWRDRLLLVRGITPELWHIDAQGQTRRLAELRGADEGWFGGSLRSVDPWVPGAGILVTDVVAREPADRSGVVAGDWIRSWNGAPVPDLPTFMQRVAATTPDREIIAEVRRRGELVMDHFLAGRRPVGQGRLLNYGSLWVAADGRVLLPGRTGLSWVNPSSATRAALWTWNESGVVEQTLVCGPQVLVCVRRRLVPDLVLAVDLSTGQERWRVEMDGDIDRMQPVGSAVWISAWEPSTAVLLDVNDGSERAAFICTEHTREEYRNTWAVAHASDVAAGRVFSPQGGPQPLRCLRVINSTRGVEEWRDGGATGWSDQNQNDMVAAGPATALLRRGLLQLCVVDPLGQAARMITLQPSLLMEAHAHWGPLDDDTRLFVRGWTLFLVRVPDGGRFNINASAWAVDPHVLAAAIGAASDEELPPPLSMRTGQALLTGSGAGTRYLLDANATFEGLVVLGARMGSDPRVDMRWISAGLRSEHSDVRLYEAQVREPRRHLPVRVGARLLVPSDVGAIVLEVPSNH